jgi:hypothetical protein
MNFPVSLSFLLSHSPGLQLTYCSAVLYYMSLFAYLSVCQSINLSLSVCHQERKMFELPEEEKMVFCERHRLLGNFLYAEGVLPKAAEQYKTVSE